MAQIVEADPARLPLRPFQAKLKEAGASVDTPRRESTEVERHSFGSLQLVFGPDSVARIASYPVQRKVPEDAEDWRKALDLLDHDPAAQKHIVRWRHAWDLLSTDFNYPDHDGDKNWTDNGTWNFVKSLMLETLWYGEQQPYGRVTKKVLRKWGQTIEVTYNTVGSGYRVSDGWVVADRPKKKPKA